MKVTRTGNQFSFYFTSLKEIADYNEWIDLLRIDAARVEIQGTPPSSRVLRKILTKRPSILEARDEEAVTEVLDRWTVTA